MPTRPFTIVALALLVSLFSIDPVAADNDLEVTFLQWAASGGGTEYDATLRADKTGATTAKLVTSTGTYALQFTLNSWEPAGSFAADYDGLSFAALWADISQGWTLTWDEGLATETVANIGFGTVNQADFLPNPILTSPADGEVIVGTGAANPPTVEWNYGGTDACVAQPEDVMVYLVGPGPQYIVAGTITCDQLSWTHTAPLADGAWDVHVFNYVDSYRLVADGIGGAITGDPWVLEDADWCGLWSPDSHGFTMPVETGSFGTIKARYLSR